MANSELRHADIVNVITITIRLLCGYVLLEPIGWHVLRHAIS